MTKKFMLEIEVEKQQVCRVVAEKNQKTTVAEDVVSVADVIRTKSPYDFIGMRLDDEAWLLHKINSRRGKKNYAFFPLTHYQKAGVGAYENKHEAIKDALKNYEVFAFVTKPQFLKWALEIESKNNNGQ